MPSKILISCSSSLSLINFRGKLIEELLKEYSVYVFTPTITEPEIRSKLHRMGLVVYENRLMRNNVSVFADFQYIFQLFKIIKEIKPDIFFSYTFKPVIFGSWVAAVCGVKSINAMLTGLGYNFTDSGSKNSTVRNVTKSLLKLSLNSSKRIKVIFQNRDNYEELKRLGILTDKNRVFVVNGSGIDLDHFTYSEPDTSEISFLMIARLIKSKGVREYFDAAEKVKKIYPNVKFRLIGGFEEDGIDSISNELFERIKSNEVIEYNGKTNDVRPFIEKASVIVLPSYAEGIPRSILEAMAMGRAVITTDAPGCKETVSNTLPNGFLVPTKNVESLAAKMEYFISNPQDIITMGHNGRIYATEKYDVHSVNAEMLKILK